jgi:hypothetical protein
MRQRIKAALRIIASDSRLEARWLNTLSYLEFVGARKISRTVAASHPHLDVLDHLADETRHAMAFKQLASQLVGGEPGDYLCRKAAGTYFHKLDRELSAWTTDLVGREHSALNYLLVTSMIERRAMTLYPLYRSASRHDFVREELQQIVTEEQGHRVRIEEDCIRLLSEWNISSLSAPDAVESAYFDEFWTVLEAEIGIGQTASTKAAV